VGKQIKTLLFVVVLPKEPRKLQPIDIYIVDGSHFCTIMIMIISVLMPKEPRHLDLMDIYAAVNGIFAQ
jgi:hypothetical protein